MVGWITSQRAVRRAVGCVALAAAGVLFVGGLAPAFGGGGDEKYEKKVEAIPDPVPVEKLTTGAAPAAGYPWGYCSPGGSFDLKTGGCLQYLRGNTFDVEKCVADSEDANYYYCHEQNFPAWRWAFGKNPVPGYGYVIRYTHGGTTWDTFSPYGLRGSH